MPFLKQVPSRISVNEIYASQPALDRQIDAHREVCRVLGYLERCLVSCGPFVVTWDFSWSETPHLMPLLEAPLWNLCEKIYNTVLSG